jgi:hypothetical protein
MCQFKKENVKRGGFRSIFLTIFPNLQIYSIFAHDVGLRKQKMTRRRENKTEYESRACKEYISQNGTQSLVADEVLRIKCWQNSES